MIFRSLVIRGWSCVFGFVINGYDAKALHLHLRECDAPQSVVERVSRNVYIDAEDTGFTYSNPDLRRSLVVIGRASSGAEFLNTFIHEVQHLTEDISRGLGLSMGEGTAYLSGDIAFGLADIVCRLACDDCRKNYICETEGRGLV